MSEELIIIGAGFAARQLVRNLRQQDKTRPIRLIASDSGDEYNKPDLSHVFTNAQRADDLTRQTAGDWAEQNHLLLHPHTQVTGIDVATRTVETSAGRFAWQHLVLATGAQAVLPPVSGSELMFTLNSQQEYRQCEAALRDAKRVLLLGGGLIGTELAMDLNRAGKKVTLVDTSTSLLSTVLVPEISARLQTVLAQHGVTLRLSTGLASLARHHDSLVATLSDGHQECVDAVVCAIGLRPDLTLAHSAGLATRRGIVVDDRLSTSHPAIYALGDCAEIRGRLLPFLQPAQLCAMTLAKNLSGAAQSLTLPAMLVKVKTPLMPLHLAGDTANRGLDWEMRVGPGGVIARGRDEEGVLRAFVVSEDHMKQAFGLLKELNAGGN
ncbi:Nitric oxide reductase FlRd-NAD(+) reductase [Cronobacter condimenti 1330]|uniref:NADH:flavorubredoxin oxidoreductase n=1 Tax=Cronobacter condimenti 1330 TaxID=1073999 RepID=K8A1V8_9ENTR|nr:NADH:flavorubredoxin reductase NorW [Cronobacter condimenti]ALB63396.1 NADH:flavorubredoxin oxidoreductase [Cronobacter condimenti 1330]CCJ73588.1 Nitric oxide reductase FlRd-NAD(+) reductase [Cronobacter condimenti 1330]